MRPSISGLGMAVGFLCFAVLITSLQADTVLPPGQLVFSSEQSSDVVFVMMPAKPGEFTKSQEKAYGVVYQLNKRGRFKEVYRTQGWYSSKVYVSSDGRYLVRMGPWSSGSKPAEGDLAVAFYKDGELLKKYSTAELVKDHSKVVATASHYFWQGAPLAVLTGNGKLRCQPRLDHSNDFRLNTIDGWTYLFDATTGEITDQHRSE